jgi:hypothetical protein
MLAFLPTTTRALPCHGVGTTVLQKLCIAHSCVWQYSGLCIAPPTSPAESAQVAGQQKLLSSRTGRREQTARQKVVSWQAVCSHDSEGLTSTQLCKSDNVLAHV